MKKQKRFLAVLLVVSMVVSLGTTVWAEENSSAAGTEYSDTADKDSENKADIAVNGEYLSELESDTVISVNVAWTDMHFKYAASQQGTWNPENHTYKDAVTEGMWLKDSATITVANHSNEKIIANLNYQQTDTDIIGTLNKKELSLANAAEGTSLNDPDSAPSETVSFTVSGAMSEDSTNLGTITVSIAADVVLDLTGVDTANYAAQIQKFVKKNKVTELRMKLGTASVSRDQGNAIKEGCNAANVTEIAILDVTSVKDRAFYQWSAVTSISLPEVTSITTYSFSCLDHLTTLDLPKLQTTTGVYVINECKALKELYLPELTDTQGRLISDCTSLETLNLPKLKTVGDTYTFSASTALKNVNLPELTTAVEGMFNACTALENIELPKVTEVAADMFTNCKNLETASFPAVMSVGRASFNQCSNLKTLSFGTVLTNVDKDAFYGIANTSNVTLKLNSAQTAVNNKELVWGLAGSFNGCTFKEVIAAN